MTGSKTWRAVVAGLTLAMVLSTVGCTKYGTTLSRPFAPVVLEGAQVPNLLGTDPRHVVGFAWDGSSWHQVPVQVDERDLVSPGVIYHLPTSSYPKLYGTSALLTIPVYTPPATATADYRSYATYTPPDSDPTVDADDEISFLADDTGVSAPPEAGTPTGVDPTTREVVAVTDPLAPTQQGYVYLFHSDTLTGGSAGTTGVDYQFSLDSGDYLATYKMGNASLAPNKAWGFNPEHSTVTTPVYAQTFSDRWLQDGLTINHAGTTSPDLLDRSMYNVPLGCGRTEDTFDGADTGEGAFIVNISGPVRAIRSYLGANSFKWTSVSDVFYPGRQDTTIDLRGHAGMPGFGMADDFTTGLTGLTYSDAANTALPIDGSPDTFTPITATTGGPTAPSWQVVTGPQGSLFTSRSIDTSITGLVLSSTYVDQSPASPKPCTGDTSSWGRSGFQIMSPGLSVPGTDPTLAATYDTFTSSRTRYFAGPDFDVTAAPMLDAQVQNPLTVTVTN